MANITQYLKNIAEAEYGEDVRWSIHDGIDAINKDVVTANNTANSAKTTAQSANTASQQAVQQAASATTAATNATNAANQATASANTAVSQAAASAQTATQKAAEARLSAENALAAYESLVGTDIDVLLETLAMEHRAESSLKDSDGNIILDSNGDPIKGQTIFVDITDFMTLREAVFALETLVSELRIKAAEPVVDPQLEQAVSSNSERISKLETHSLLDSGY